MELVETNKGDPVCPNCNHVLRPRCKHLRLCLVCDNCNARYEKVEE